MRYKTLIYAGLALLAVSLLLAACGRESGVPTLPPPSLDATQAPCPTGQPCPNCPTCPTPEEGGAAVDQVPFAEVWAASPHADAEAEAFIHWNEEDPQEVPVDCATCHSTPGYQDYLGADGSAQFVVDAPAPVGTTITCNACHNQAAQTLDSVPFPSGAVIGNIEDEARCMVCHQGRSSSVHVNDAIEAAGLTEDVDTVNADLRFINIHYYAAAATLYGGEAHGGYEYDGQTYDPKFMHVESFDTCIECHDSHSLEVRVDQCSACHDGVASVEDLREVRMPGSLSDYDGDGDLEEGIASEIAGLQETLLQEMQTYAADTAGTAIAYNEASHPYFFIDTNADGAADEAEAISDNRYNAWTARLLKAGYNYQTSLKDPGAFAHNAKYIIELLYDSIADLRSAGGAEADMGTMARVDPGHFQGTAEAFRHWDAEGGVVPRDCVKCHTATGLPVFLAEAAASRDQVTGATVSMPASNGLACETCHDDLTSFSRYEVNQVKFPSGAVLSFGEGVDSNLCINCHQGREANSTVQAAISNSKAETPDTPSEALSFRNPHYFAAGATLFGGEAMGAYQYEGKEYSGRFLHVENMSTCAQCHDAHELGVNVQLCSACHTGVDSTEDLPTIRFGATSAGIDYDGDGNAEEGIGEEVGTMHEALYAAIQAYAADTAGAPILYNNARYPYWFNDANANNTIDEGEANYASWTPRLLAAAYNYTWVTKDPGSFAHNGRYILQVLYDSLEDLGVDVSGMTRPEVQATTP